jgi:hypothetical protein
MKRSKMLKRLPSPALVVACVALVAALGGTAVALPGKGGVDKNDIRANAVSGKTIRPGAVTSDKIADATVGTADLADGTVGNADLADGSVTTAKLASSALPNVVAYGKVTNPDPGAPTLSASSGLNGVTVQGGDGEGSTRVAVSADAIPGPGSNVSGCTVQTTLSTQGQPNASLGFPSFIITGTGNGLPVNVVQVQTRADTLGLADRDYYIAVVCTPV